MLIVSDSWVIDHMLLGLDGKNARHPNFACYFGAGGSFEAKVPTATEISRRIRRDLRVAESKEPHVDERDYDTWDISELDWGKPTCYMRCMKKRFSNSAERVEYFRRMLENKQPSFSHHAVALLMKHQYLKSTCLTTNFDKLIEIAFAQQAEAECQPIRTEQEANYWVNAEQRYFVMKLHGDYDTDNIANTLSETVRISDAILDRVHNLLDYSGLVVLGSAGNEKSIHTMFDILSNNKIPNRVFRFGLFWGVYVGPSRPQAPSQSQIESLVMDSINQGNVGSDIYRMMADGNVASRPFYFFPVWGTGNFLFDLIKATGDSRLAKSAALYLDHKMRLRYVFSIAKLSETAIESHISALEERQKSIEESSLSDIMPKEILAASSNISSLKVRVVYGDITHDALIDNRNGSPKRVAIVSPEDTCISAGGGAAYKILTKAGKQFILNELAKLTPLEQRQVAVTSGGKLGAQYIFHAAAADIKQVGDKVDYSISKSAVCDVLTAVLNKALALDVNEILIPLIGAGVVGLASESSLESILQVVRDRDWGVVKEFCVSIVILRDEDLERHDAKACVKRMLSSQFTIKG